MLLFFMSILIYLVCWLLDTIGFVVVDADDALTGMEVGYFIVVFLRLGNVAIMLNSWTIRT